MRACSQKWTNRNARSRVAGWRLWVQSPKEISGAGLCPAEIISSRAQQNGPIVRPFSFLKNYSDRNSDQQVGKFGKYRAPRLYKGARWWIEYQFRVPLCVRHLHKNKTWEKLRVFEDINRHKSDEYAQALLTAINFALKEGFDPFEDEKQLQEQIQQEVACASVRDKVSWKTEADIGIKIVPSSIDKLPSLRVTFIGLPSKVLI
jgi:hypothetical protein